MTPAIAHPPAPAAAETGKVYTVAHDPKPSAIVIHCSDPRFQQPFAEFLEKELGLAQGDYIPIIVGGGAGVLGHPEQLPKEFKFIRERLEHYRQIFPTARRLILMNHEGCRYYEALKDRAGAIFGGRVNFAALLPKQDLSLVARTLRHFLAHLGHDVELYYARFTDQTRTQIRIDKIEA